MSNRYAREYLCPAPAEHGEIVYVPGVLRYSVRTGQTTWERTAPIPVCPVCGVIMVHDTDDRNKGE